MKFADDVQERWFYQSLAACAAWNEHPRRVEAADRTHSNKDQEKVLLGELESARRRQRKCSHSPAACAEGRVPLQTWVPKNCKL